MLPLPNAFPFLGNGNCQADRSRTPLLIGQTEVGVDFGDLEAPAHPLVTKRMRWDESLAGHLEDLAWLYVQEACNHVFIDEWFISAPSGSSIRVSRSEAGMGGGLDINDVRHHYFSKNVYCCLRIFARMSTMALGSVRIKGSPRSRCLKSGGTSEVFHRAEISARQRRIMQLEITLCCRQTVVSHQVLQQH